MMKTMVMILPILLFGTASASFFPVFTNQRHSTSSLNQADEECNHEEDSNPVYHHTRLGSTTTPGPLWRTTTSSYDISLDRHPPYLENTNPERRREEPERHTTENWKAEVGTERSGVRHSTEWGDFDHRQSTQTLSTLWKKTDSREFYETSSSKNSFEREDGFRMRLAEKWCSRYEKKCISRRDVGNGLVSRIIGGRPAKPREHPHMVMVGYGPEDDKQWLCGGSLISNRYVLSAAHCSQTVKWGPAKWARLGILDISTDEETTAQEKRIVERIRHPGYKEPATYHDIVLFKMDSDVTFTAWVYPTCLHVGRSISASTATTTGWGRTGFVSETSPVLLEVNVSIFSDNYCNATISKGSGSKMPHGFDAETMVCAGEVNGGKDACQGDSGGPLVIAGGGCVKNLIGITSVGRECGLPESPGVYTRVSEYVPWIEGIVWS